MKAGIYIKKGDVRLEERPIPEIGAKDVLVKVARAGVCSSDMMYYTMGGEPWVQSGSIMGHELVGTIVKVGEEVSSEIQVGQRVFVHPVLGSPAEKNGIIGGFREYVDVINAELGKSLFILPDNVSFADAVIIEPFSVAMNGVMRADLKPTDHVVVMGAGPIGLMALAGLRAQGFEKVVITDIRDEAVEVAKEFGGIAVNTKKKDLKEFLIEQFGEVENNLHEMVPDVDVYLDYAGAPGLPNEILALAKNGTKHIFVAAYKYKTSFEPMEMQKLTCVDFEMRGSYTYSLDVIKEVIRLLATGNCVAPKVITHVYPMEEFSEAIRCAAEESDSLKVVVNISDY